MVIFLTYDYLTRHIVPGPRSFPYFAPFILQPLALLIPRSVLSRWQSIAIFIPLITLSTIHAWRDMNGVDVISVNGLLWSLFLIAFQDPWKNFRVVGQLASKHNDEVATAEKQCGRTESLQTTRLSAAEEVYPPTLGKRLVWVGKLLASIRLDNWKIGRHSHDRQQPSLPGFSSRRHFLAHALLSLIRGFAVLDLTRNYIEYDPYFTNLNVDITSSLPFDAGSFISPRVFRSMIIGAQAWALIGEMFYLPAVIPVVLNAFGVVPDRLSPHNWPSYFGTPEAILRHGVRGFWGTFWHQTMRWTTSGPGYALADAFNLHHKSLLRYGIISISAFGMSGIVHMGLVPPEPLYATKSVSTIRLCMAGFFWLQAVAVLVEALTARVITSITGNARWINGIGYSIRMLVNCIWTLAWFSFCIPFLGEAARQMTYWAIWPLPVSAIRGLTGQGWITWSILL